MESLSTLEMAYSAVVVLTGYAVRGAAGFGAGVVAIPLLALVLPMQTIAPVITLLGITASIGQGIKDREMICWGTIVPVILPALAGVLAGLYLFKTLDQATLGRVLGIFVIVYAAYSLLPSRIQLPLVKASPFWAVALGAPGGLIATLFGGMAGPLFVIYLDVQRLHKTAFRVTVATLLLMVSGMRVIGYLVSGFFDLKTMLVFASSLPLMVMGMILGEHIHIKVNQQAFTRIVGAILVGSGVALMLK